MSKDWKGAGCNSGAGAVYGLGLVGALIYYLSHVTTLMAGAVGVLKALVWPAILILKVFELLRL
jgi:hypothetical protein